MSNYLTATDHQTKDFKFKSRKKSSHRDLGNNQIEELLPGVFNKNTELTKL